MTNGEKLKEIFPNGVLTSVYNSIYWGDDILVSKSWWNAEYKPNKSEIPTSLTTKNNLAVAEMIRLVRESDVIDRTDGSELAKAFNYLFDKYIENPTAKNESGVDCISRQEAIDTIRQLYLDLASQKAVIDLIKALTPVTPQDPITKNDLGVDAISRADARSLICKIDIKYHISGISRKAFKDLYNGMDELPSVTPIRPKGHWIWCGGSHKCSNCEEYTCFSHKVRYCPNCGSDNREVEE